MSLVYLKKIKVAIEFSGIFNRSVLSSFREACFFVKIIGVNIEVNNFQKIEQQPMEQWKNLYAIHIWFLK